MLHLLAAGSGRGASAKHAKVRLKHARNDVRITCHYDSRGIAFATGGRRASAPPRRQLRAANRSGRVLRFSLPGVSVGLLEADLG